MPQTLLQTLLLIALLNGVLAVPLMLLWKRDFARQGHVSKLGATWSGVTMHGHAVLTGAVAWVDRGSILPPSLLTIIIGGSVLVAGASIIAAGRMAYGSQARVYGLLEDKLIDTGIYRWTRNPQYFGYWLMFMGAGIAAMSVWGLVLAAAFLPAVHVHIIWVEEPHLRRTFGEAFTTYTSQVRRYWGRKT